MNATTRRRSASCVAWLPLLVWVPVGAQVAPADADLEEIIVTGSRIQQRLEDAPVAVVVLDRDDIDRATHPLLGRTYYVSLSYRIE